MDFLKLLKLKNNYEKPSEKKKNSSRKYKRVKNLINLKIDINYRGGGAAW